MRQKMYSFVNKDLSIGGGLEIPTLSIQVRKGGECLGYGIKGPPFYWCIK